jgi:hypothetical protein
MTARYPINKDPVKSSKDTASVAKEIPDVIIDPNSKRKYERGRFLGKVFFYQFKMFNFFLRPTSM